MCKIILFKIIRARNQIKKLFITPGKACHYVELEPVETQNAKTSTTSLKKGKYLEKKRFGNLSDLMSNFFFRTESILCKSFLDRLVSNYS